MAATPLSFAYDPDRWIHVPLDYVQAAWRDAREWSAWLADEALRGREGTAVTEEVLAEHALGVALFPAEHVSARFWHFPVDGIATGFVDLYVQARVPDGTPLVDLLPDPGFTMVTPVDEHLEAPSFDQALRRLTLSALIPAAGADPVIVPRAEWIGAIGQWLCYAISRDHDVHTLLERVPDIDRLFAAVDLSSVSA